MQNQNNLIAEGQRLRILMFKKGIRPVDVAAALGKSKPCVTNALKGKSNLRKLLSRISEFVESFKN